MRQHLFHAALAGAVFVAAAAGAQETAPTYAEVKKVLSHRCQTCHSEYPSQMEFSESGAPNGVKFDTPSEIKIFSPKILKKAVEEKSMPPGNITNITEGERDQIGAWIKAGANVN